MLAFLVELGLVTYRDVTQGGDKVPNKAPIHAPLPSLYTSAIIVFGGLALLPKSLEPVPGLVGWGFVVATLLNVFTPGSANAAAAASKRALKGLTSAPVKTKTTATK